jgi:hypothetical protein
MEVLRPQRVHKNNEDSGRDLPFPNDCAAARGFGGGMLVAKVRHRFGEFTSPLANDMKMSRCIGSLALALVVSSLVSCAHTPAQVADTRARFHDGAAANVVVHFSRWDSIFMLRPDTREDGFLPLLNRDDVAHRIDQAGIGRDLAVVILGYTYTGEQVAELFREWNALLGQHGFRRVVVLRVGRKDEIDGLPVLCDSAITGGT